MSDVILSPKSDLIFKLLFSDERNIEFLKGLLKAVLDLPEDDYNDIALVDPHLLRDYPGDKLGILDVKLTSKTGKVINLEVQVAPVPMMESRILFYQSKMITGQLGEGEDYEKIKRVINIVITDYDFIKESTNYRYHHRFIQYDPENHVTFTDLTEIHTLELSKLPEKFDGSDLCDWMKFLAAETEEEFSVVAERNPTIEKAVVRLKELSADERTRMLYEAREKERRDNRAREKGARNEGRIEGRMEGRAEGIVTVAKGMLSKNFPLETIIELTGLTHGELESLRSAF